MKKIGIFILSIIAIIVGLVLILKDKIFGEFNETSEASKTASTASSTASTSTSPYIIETSLTAILSRIVSTTIGTIVSGKIFIQIENTGTTSGTINVGNGNSILRAGETWYYNEFKTPGVKAAGQILFDATGTSFLINTEDK